MKTCLLSGNFALDTIVMRDYPNGFVVGKSNKFTETIVTETVGNTCGNVACILANLGVQTFPIAHLDLSEQGHKIKEDLQRYGADVRFVENSASGGTTLLRCTHKRDKTTGEHIVSFRATSPGSRFPKRRFLRVRDEAPAFMENLDFTPDVFFFDAAEAGLRYLAGELRKRGTLVYFEPESDADKNKFLKAVEVSDIVAMQKEANEVYVHPSMIEYITAIVEATRKEAGVVMGVSTRGSLALLKAAKAYAYIQGRNYVVPEDVKTLAIPVLAHRMVLNFGYHKEADNKQKLKEILDKQAVPTEEFDKK